MSLFKLKDHEILLKLECVDLNDICRACLKNNSEMKSVFSHENFAFTSDISVFDALDFVNRCSGLKFAENDDMPSMLCLDCIKNLSLAYNFIKLCERTDRILRQLKIKLKNTDPVEMCQLNNSAAIQTSIKHKDLSETSHSKSNEKKKELLIKTAPVRTDFGDDMSLCDDNEKEYSKNEDDGIASNSQNEKVLIESIIINSQIDDIGNCDQSPEEPEHNRNSNKCPICQNTFTTIRGLRLHSRVHSPSEHLSCGACGRIFKDAFSLRDHRLSHAGDKPYQCSFCDKKFAQKKPLQNHEKTHTGDRPYVCDICGKSYIQPSNLVIHKRLHTGEKPFVCKECGKAFTNRASLTLHMPVHTGAKDFVCTICGKRIARSGELTIHMRTHSGEKPYSCRTCSKAFIKKSSLQEHMYSHTGEKKYVCPICGLRMAHAGKLTVHIRTHSSAKPFACPICDRRFANQGYLKQHSKTHSGDRAKPFICTHCGKGFVNNRNLSEHLRTHTGERPFVCLVCNHNFAQRSTLNFHIKSAHGEPKDLISPKQVFHNQDRKENDSRLFTLEPKCQEQDGASDINVTEHIKEDNKMAVNPVVRLVKRDISSPPPSVIHPNPQDFSSFKSTANSYNIPPSPCDLRTVPDHRGAYDPRLSGYSHYPL